MAVAAVSWLFLPWLEILTRIRTLRLPKEKQLRPKSPPSSDTFPTLNEITREIENEGFVHVNDAGWDWEDYRQFFRLFYKEEDRAQATICLNEQHDLSFYYLRISSRARERHHLDDVELSALLRLETNAAISNQSAASGSIVLAALSKPSRVSCASTTCKSRRSRRWMKRESSTRWRTILRDQIAHNIHKGVLKQTPEGDVKIFLARDDLSLVPVSARSGAAVSGSCDLAIQ